LCQYAVERIANNVHWAGIIPQYLGGRLDRHTRDDLELDDRYQLSDDLASRADRLDDDEPTQSEESGEHQEPEEEEQEGSSSEQLGGAEQSSAAPNPNAPVPDSQMPPVFLELRTNLAANSKMHNKQFPFFTPFVAGASNNMPYMPFDKSQPGYRSFKNAVEKQKFAEIYHVADITLDHICEASMPNEFYPTCSTLLQAQGAITNLLARQYGVTTICLRLGFCGEKSYVSRGVHTPEEPLVEFPKRDLIGNRV
jgi:hypothetical protein